MALAFTGDAIPIAQQVMTGGGSGIRGAFSVSQAGVLAYATGSAESGGNADPIAQLVWFDRTGKRLGTIGEPARLQNAQLSADGKRVVVNIFDGSRRTRDVWIVDAERGLRTRLTFDPGDDTQPIWAPDAEKILFNAHDEIHVKNASGAGDGELSYRAADDGIMSVVIDTAGSAPSIGPSVPLFSLPVGSQYVTQDGQQFLANPATEEVPPISLLLNSARLRR